MKQILKSFILAIISFFFTMHIHAQDKYSYTNRMNIRLSGGIAAQNGANYNQLFSNGKSGPYGSIFVGYRFDENTNVANYFGVFGTVTKMSGTSVQQMDIDKVLALSPNFNGNASNSYEAEAGFVFGDWFRLSAGVGTMQIPTVGAWQNNNYYTGTSGFLIGRNAVNFHATTTVLFGGDLTKTAFRVNAGLGFSFKFLKGRKKYS
jgi:hypothetical protein